MIQSGKTQGWLTAPAQRLSLLSTTSGVDFGPCSIADVPAKGAGLVAKQAVSRADSILMTVPSDLVLSKESIKFYAQSDKHLRDVLNAVGDWKEITHHCPNKVQRVGVSSPLDDYVKSLPLVVLPSNWTEEEQELLLGTSLWPLLQGKISALHQEYDEFEKLTRSAEWCRKEWWDEVDGLMSFADWSTVDTMWRSRALECSGVGECMVPCIDLANHGSGTDTVARWQSDGQGNVQLLLDEGKQLAPGDEILITYGDHKGACEMMYSYGFLERGMIVTPTMLIEVPIPSDDPSRELKQRIAGKGAIGVEISWEGSHVRWDSEYLWLVALNTQDGFSLEVLQNISGEEQLQVYWEEQPVANIENVPGRMRNSSRSPLFELRMVSLLSDRVKEHLHALHVSDEAVHLQNNVRADIKQQAIRLRSMEYDLLRACDEDLIAEMHRLAKMDVVRDFLAEQNPDDFS